MANPGRHSWGGSVLPSFALGCFVQILYASARYPSGNLVRVFFGDGAWGVISKVTVCCILLDLLQSFINIKFVYLYRSNNTKYDLVFMEEFLFQSYYGLIHHVGSPPVIGIMPFQFFWLPAEEFAIPNNPSYVPDPGFDLTDRMTFYERMESTLWYLWLRFVNIISSK
ncbi:hypothetical protein C0J52_04341 [Blattella germanica]|nr:hypothetical protein C0J52_04341 [Blattella germanica]